MAQQNLPERRAVQHLIDKSGKRLVFFYGLAWRRFHGRGAHAELGWEAEAKKTAVLLLINREEV